MPRVPNRKLSNSTCAISMSDVLTENLVHPLTNNWGETVFVFMSGKPVFDDSGKFAVYGGIGRDI